MIDLHNHILPGLDDGAADLDESVEIGRQFAREGVVRVAATPHLDPERGNGAPPSTVLRAVAEVRDALAGASVPLDVVPGNELYLVPHALELMNRGEVLPLGGGHAVLVELSVLGGERPLFLDDTIFHLQRAGYTVILAHPERYGFVQRDVARIDDLVRREVALQLTAPALLGEYGPGIRRTAERLLKRGSYSLAASDRHHPGPTRSLAETHARITTLTDRDTADLLLQDNPDRVLRDLPLEKPDAAQPGSSFFRRLLGQRE